MGSQRRVHRHVDYFRLIWLHTVIAANALK